MFIYGALKGIMGMEGQASFESLVTKPRPKGKRERKFGVHVKGE